MATLSYELRVGVTGHRTIADDAAVTRAIRTLLDRVAATLERSASVPLDWTVTSPLAKGADRLVVRAVLERQPARLEVVTPFPLEEYRQDFESEEDRAEFERLLARAAVVGELDPVALERHQDADARAAERDAAYLSVGERVVDACEMLIAVWDGRRAAGVGGTADIVRYALEQERVVLWIDPERPEKEPRMIRAVSYGASGDLASIRSEMVPRAPRRLSRGYCQQAAYFRDASLDTARLAAQRRDVEERLRRAADEAQLPPGALDAVVTAIVPEYVRADELALLYQHKHELVIHGVLYLAASAVTIAAAQLLFFPDQVWLIVFEVAAMVAVLGLWWAGRYKCWHEKWLHDRYLAERLRTEIFTSLVESGSNRAHRDDPLPFYRGPQQWLAHTVDQFGRSARDTIQSLPLDSLRKFLLLAWLQDQQRFHARNAGRKARSARRRQWLGFALFGMTLLMALLHLLGVAETLESEEVLLRHPNLWISFLALVLPVWAGAVHAVTSQLELERIAERSRRMSRALESLAQRTARARSREELQGTVSAVAELMGIETHEWWVLLSFQDVRLHV